MRGTQTGTQCSRTGLMWAIGKLHEAEKSWDRRRVMSLTSVDSHKLHHLSDSVLHDPVLLNFFPLFFFITLFYLF